MVLFPDILDRNGGKKLRDFRRRETKNWRAPEKINPPWKRVQATSVPGSIK
jgi:hypothetical protein